jgi:hypothetical protein
VHRRAKELHKGRASELRRGGLHAGRRRDEIWY